MKKNKLSRRAFTLIELLVVIAIIALLLSIIVPSLRIIKEQARKITCANNLKSIGTAIYIYVNSNDDSVPEALYRGGSTGGYTMPYYSYMAYQIDSSQPWGQHITSGPSNLAHLYDSNLIDTPETFYCDSAVKHPDGPSNSSQVSYHYDGYHDDAHSWPWNTQAGTGLNFHVVRVSYNYVPQSSREKDDMGFPAIARKATQFHASYPLCADLIKDIYTLPHKKGSGKFAGGLNVLFSDGHAEFCNNPEAFDEGLWLSGSPNSDPALFRTILNLLK